MILPTLSPPERHFLETNLSRFSDPGCHIPAEHVPKLERVFQEALDGKRQFPETTVYLLESVKEDFLRKLEGRGLGRAKPRIDCIVDSLLCDSRYQELSQMDGSFFFENFMYGIHDCKLGGFLGAHDSDGIEILTNMWFLLPDIMNGRNWFLNNLTNMLRFPSSLGLIVGALDAFGRVGYTTRFMPDLYSEDEAENLKKEKAHPVCLSPYPNDTDGYRNIPPFIVFLHDVLVHGPHAKNRR